MFSALRRGLRSVPVATTIRPAAVRTFRKYTENAVSYRWMSSAANEKRESMEFDVVVVGGGPAGLSAAIRLKQLAAAAKSEISVCVVEKGAEIGSHILSGNVFDPRYLNELIPNWHKKGAPLTTPVTEDRLLFLTEENSVPLGPIPPVLNNHGNYIISLGSLVRWLGTQASELGVELYPGFAASEVLYSDDKQSVVGIATNDMGVSKGGEKLSTFQRGMELRAKQTLFAEGARGSLSELVMSKFNLRANCDPQHYGLGLKEVWEIDPAKHQAGLVTHSFGWPMDTETYGGSFMYHMNPNLLLIGYVVGLDYKNPYLSPYEEFQRFKQHKAIRPVLEGGKCISYGARVINEGGFQSIPKLTFPGGALIGCSAGFVNLPKIKGSHNAMKSGMVAAESLFPEFERAKKDTTISMAGREITAFGDNMKSSPVWKELRQVRNVGPAFHHFGLIGWAAYSALELFITKGFVPWTLRNPIEDVDATGLKTDYTPIEYPKPDGKISFDLLTNLARSGTNHNEDQPTHLRVVPGAAHVPVTVSHSLYDGPESRFCPAKVYEFVPDQTSAAGVKLQINAQNCVHCKTCDIKTPRNYIRWTVPEGGGGPAYENM